MATAVLAQETEGIEGRYYKDLKLCPDGSYLLALRDDMVIDMYKVNPDAKGLWRPERSLKAPSSVVSMLWYPTATAQKPEYFCFFLSIKDHPVQLIDGNSLKVRASYPIIDHTERFVAPYSMVMTSEGLLYCGLDSAIEIINIHSPGVAGHRFKTVPTKKSQEGLKGIISALALTEEGILAAGTFSAYIALYDIANYEEPLCIGLACVYNRKGVTQIVYNPHRSQLYIASRLSGTGLEVKTFPRLETVALFTRTSETNQRIHFDLNESGTYLISGTNTGDLQFFSTTLPPGNGDIQPVVSEKISRYALNSALFAPDNTIIVCDGENTFVTDEESDDESPSALQYSSIKVYKQHLHIRSIFDLSRSTPEDIDFQLRVSKYFFCEFDLCLYLWAR